MPLTHDKCEEVRTTLSDEAKENACVIGAMALAYIRRSPILTFAFMNFSQFTPQQIDATLLALAAMGKVDKM